MFQAYDVTSCDMSCDCNVTKKKKKRNSKEKKYKIKENRKRKMLVSKAFYNKVVLILERKYTTVKL